MNVMETKLDFGTLTKRKRTVRLILHHSAASGQTTEQIHAYHKKKGWKGIGYHFYVRKDGSVYRGRPEDTVGSHAAGNNSDSIGICFEGNFEVETMPDAQKAAGRELAAYLKEKYGISIIQRHKDVCATACPGRNFPFEEIAGATGQAEQPTTSVPALGQEHWTETPAGETAGGVSGEEISAKDILAVDGRWGPAVTRRLQQIFKTTVDGKISHQYACYQAQNPGLSASCWEWEQRPGRGSILITAIQHYLNVNYNAGLEENGWIGPLTIKAMQAWMGTAQDGYFSRVSTCIKRLQEWANEQSR